MLKKIELAVSRLFNVAVVDQIVILKWQSLGNTSGSIVNWNHIDNSWKTREINAFCISPISL